MESKIEGGILYVGVRGTFDMKELGNFFMRYRLLVQSSGCGKVLVDITGVNDELYERSLFTATYSVIQEYRPFVPGVYTAVIDKEELAYLVDFKVQVFRLMGYDRIAYFFDHGEALAWLKAQGTESREAKRPGAPR